MKVVRESSRWVILYKIRNGLRFSTRLNPYLPPTCCARHCFAEITEGFVFYAVLCAEYAEKSFDLLTVGVCVPLYPCISDSNFQVYTEFNSTKPKGWCWQFFEEWDIFCSIRKPFMCRDHNYHCWAVNTYFSATGLQAWCIFKPSLLFIPDRRFRESIGEKFLETLCLSSVQNQRKSYFPTCGSG
jgi:hypothetical protein